MTVTTFQDLPLADRDREWDGAAAEKRVREWAQAQDGPNPQYRDAHLWYDKEKKDNFTAYKLLIADVVDGRLAAVPRGIMSAGAVLDGARGGVRPQPTLNALGQMRLRVQAPQAGRRAWHVRRPWRSRLR